MKGPEFNKSESSAPLTGDQLAPEDYLGRRRALQQEFEYGDVASQENAIHGLTDLEAQNPSVTAAHLNHLKDQADLY